MNIGNKSCTLVDILKSGPRCLNRVNRVRYTQIGSGMLKSGPRCSNRVRDSPRIIILLLRPGRGGGQNGPQNLFGSEHLHRSWWGKNFLTFSYFISQKTDSLHSPIKRDMEISRETHTFRPKYSLRHTQSMDFYRYRSPCTVIQTYRHPPIDTHTKTDTHWDRESLHRDRH